MAGTPYKKLSWIGPKCSMCCSVTSFFGIIFCVIVGACWYTGSDMLRREVGLAYNYQQIGIACFIAAAIYVVFLLFCACQFWTRVQVDKEAQALVDLQRAQ